MSSLVIDSAFPAFDSLEFKQRFRGKAWYNANIIIWFTIFVYPLFSILDFIYALGIWQVFFLLRVSVAVILYLLYDLAVRTKQPPNTLLHSALLMLSAVQALECNLAARTVLPIYFILYTAIFISYNLIVLWESGNSFMHLLAGMFFLSGFQLIFQQHSVNEMINDGGFSFFIIAAISCSIPQIRMISQNKEITSQIELEKTNLQLQLQRDQIEEQNGVITRQNTELQRMNEQKSTFINIAGHDIRNILGGIMMPSEMLDTDNENFTAEQKELAGFIRQSATRMGYLLNKLLDLKEIQSTEINFNYEIINANREVQDVLLSLREKAALKKITLEDNIGRIPVSVRLDRVFAGQIFFNLLSNAIKFSQQNTLIEIRTWVQQNQYVYLIRDNGIPLGRTRMDEMFGKLKSLNDTSLQDEDRQGLGLSIAKLLTEAMKGTLDYQSDPEAGNSYEVRFNLA